METQVWTDGSFSNQTGIGGWAWVSRSTWRSGRTVNGDCSQAMELRAILEALRFHTEDPVVVYTDHLFYSQILGVERDVFYDWLASEERNRSALIHGLLVLLYDELEGRRVRFEHVRAHNGDRFNEMADKLARNARLADSG